MAELASPQRNEMIRTLFPPEAKRLHVFKMGSEKKAVIVYAKTLQIPSIKREDPTLEPFHKFFSFKYCPCSSDFLKGIGDATQSFFASKAPPPSPEQTLLSLAKGIPPKSPMIGPYEVEKVEKVDLDDGYWGFLHKSHDVSHTVKFKSDGTFHSAHCTVRLKEKKAVDRVLPLVWLRLCKKVDDAMHSLIKETHIEGKLKKAYGNLLKQKASHLNLTFERKKLPEFLKSSAKEASEIEEPPPSACPIPEDSFTAPSPSLSTAEIVKQTKWLQENYQTIQKGLLELRSTLQVSTEDIKALADTVEALKPHVNFTQDIKEIALLGEEGRDCTLRIYLRNGKTSFSIQPNKVKASSKHARSGNPPSTSRKRLRK